MCSSVDYWRCRWIKLGGALEYPQRGPSDPHLEPDLSTVCPQGYPQGWRADPQGWRGGTRRCGGARVSSRRRRGRRRAGPTGRSASRSPCGRAGPAPHSSAAAHRGAPATPLAPGRAVGAIAVGAQPGTAPARPGPRCPVEAVGVDPRRAGVAGATPPPPPHPGARPDRGARVDIVGVLLRTRIGSESEGLPAQRGRGRFGGGATRPLKKVAGADLSPSAPRSSRPEVA